MKLEITKNNKGMLVVTIGEGLNSDDIFELLAKTLSSFIYQICEDDKELKKNLIKLLLKIINESKHNIEVVVNNNETIH